MKKKNKHQFTHITLTKIKKNKHGINTQSALIKEKQCASGSINIYLKTYKKIGRKYDYLTDTVVDGKIQELILRNP